MCLCVFAFVFAWDCQSVDSVRVHVVMALTDVQVTICDIGVCVQVCVCVSVCACLCVRSWIVRVWMVRACACGDGTNRVQVTICDTGVCV